MDRFWSRVSNGWRVRFGCSTPGFLARLAVCPCVGCCCCCCCLLKLSSSSFFFFLSRLLNQGESGRNFSSRHFFETEKKKLENSGSRKPSYSLNFPSCASKYLSWVFFFSPLFSEFSDRGAASQNFVVFPLIFDFFFFFLVCFTPVSNWVAQPPTFRTDHSKELSSKTSKVRTEQNNNTFISLVKFFLAYYHPGL